MASQVLGIIDAVWKGSKIDCEKGSSFKLGGLKQVVVVTGQSVDYANELEASDVKVITVLRRGQSLVGLFSAGAGELQILCDTGQSYVWADAFVTNLAEATSGEGGKITMMFGGSSPQELLNG